MCGCRGGGGKQTKWTEQAKQTKRTIEIEQTNKNRTSSGKIYPRKKVPWEKSSRKKGFRKRLLHSKIVGRGGLFQWTFYHCKPFVQGSGTFSWRTFFAYQPNAQSEPNKPTNQKSKFPFFELLEFKLFLNFTHFPLNPFLISQNVRVYIFQLKTQHSVIYSFFPCVDFVDLVSPLSYIFLIFFLVSYSFFACHYLWVIFTHDTLLLF